MKFGDRIQGRVTSLDTKGRGTFDVNGRPVAIPFTAPGDTVTATFVKRDKGSKVGRLQSVDAPSPDRVATPCPHAGVCGGCLWQHLSYDAQLRFKRDAINAALAHAGHDERVESVEPSPDTLFYRNRMDYVIGPAGELGLKEYGSWNRYLNLSTCLLLDEETPRILQTVRELMGELGLKPWDARTYEGDVRYCVIRLGKNTNERMVTLVVKDLSRVSQHASRIVERLAPLCTTLYLGENPEVTDLSYAKTFQLLHGNAFLTEEVNGVRYQIHPNSFFQTNTAMAARLQSAVLAALSGDARCELRDVRILDLYCGLGFFGIAAAKQGAHVYGHELDADAIELARVNAEANGVQDRCEFGSGPVEKLDWRRGAIHRALPDAVIVDPPRAGLHPKALQALVENAPPTLVYVSCNFRRLAEELKELKMRYRIASLSAYDLFPHTPHVEVVAKLEKK